MKLFAVIMAAALLAGCSVHTPSGSVSVGPGWGYYGGHYGYDYDYDYGYHDHYRGGHFCPPGQAKKGNC